MEGKIIFEGQTANGEQYVIRYPKQGDARALLEYINTLSLEKTYILFQGEQLTLDYEINYLRGLLEKIQNNMGIHLAIWKDTSVIGICDITMLDRTQSHVGMLGISIAKDYRGQGLGKMLMEQLLMEAEKALEKLRVLTLGVYEINLTAYNLYKKFGFQEYGKLPESFYYKNEYTNELFMYKKMKK